MDHVRFDAVARAFTEERSRRNLVSIVTGLVLGSTLPIARMSTEAKRKRRKKLTVCHKGRTIRIPKRKLKRHLKHGDTRGRCRCKDNGASCTADFECCSGICDSYFERCEPERFACDPDIPNDCGGDGLCCDNAEGFFCLRDTLNNQRACGTTCQNIENCLNVNGECENGQCCCPPGGTCPPQTPPCA